MPRLVIDSQEVEIEPGRTVLDAARRLGIDIPALCFLEGRPPATSCMLCLVKRCDTGELAPSCALRAEEGLVIESETPEVRDARRAALSLLLGDHLGDCEAPCHAICPAHMNIPRMIRQIAAGRLDDAIATVKADIALPGVLGRICPAPCERGCRRAAADEPVAICLLKRFVADADLAEARPYLPPRRQEKGRKVAIVGAGPAGLAAAYYLLQDGYACTLFDARDEPGGMLRYGVQRDRLPLDVLDAEIDAVRRLGAVWRMATPIGEEIALADLRSDFDAVFLAVGRIDAAQVQALGVEAGAKGIQVERHTLATSLAGVYAGGDAVRANRLTVWAVADGKAAAASIDQQLSGRPVTGPRRPLSVHIGRLREGEIDAFLATASGAGRVRPPADSGLTAQQARQEALRCLHCDCRKPDTCKLRIWADRYAARPARFGTDRRRFQQDLTHPAVIYEPGKCIRCGICIRITAEAGEPLGLTFLGRGYDARVAVPMGRPLAEGLTDPDTVARCVEACPTGALAFREATE
jgi:ferredoxin